MARDSLIAGLHGNEPDYDPHRLEMLIYRLRRKAREQGLPALPLVTVRGGGYAFIAHSSTP